MQVEPGGTYLVTLPLRSAADSARASHLFLTWLWYASRRAEISLDGAAFTQHPRATVVAALGGISSTLDLVPEDIEALADGCEIETYGPGERIEWEGRVPARVAFIHSGTVRVTATTLDGARVPVATWEKGEVIGLTGMTREPAVATSEAVDVVEVIQMPLEVLDRIIEAKPRVARRLANSLDARRQQVTSAFDAVNSNAAVIAPVVAATDAVTVRSGFRPRESAR